MPLRPSASLVGISRAAATIAAALTLVAPTAVRAQVAPGASGGVHVVASGDTLSGIALDAGTDVSTLLDLNGLDDPDALRVGQALKLPGGAAVPVAAAPASAATGAQSPTTSYVVAEGDTLWGIAQQFSTTTDRLVALNHLEDPNRLILGATLTVPGLTVAPAPPPPAAPASPPIAQPAAPGPATSVAPIGPKRAVMVTYTVRTGETLYAIARQFDLKPDTIAQSNGLDDPSRIRAGLVLKIPLPGREHLVQAGETLRDIALGEKVDLGALIDFNALDDPELIRVGQVIVIPAQPANLIAITTAPQQQAAATPPSPPAEPAAPSPQAQRAAAPAPTSSPTPTPVRKSTPIPLPPNAPTDGLAGAALKFLGAPYVWGGSSPKGFDCSGFVWYATKAAGRPLSRGLLGQFNSGAHPSRDDLKVGDLVFFQNTYTPGLSHNGVYIGNNLFVHAADETAGVTISRLTTPYWTSHWFGATRLP